MGIVTKEETGKIISLLKQKLQEPEGTALAEAMGIHNAIEKGKEFPINSIEYAILSLAGVCDGAVQKDGVGFNAWDAELGHALAAKIQRGEALSSEERRGAYKLLKKYKRQLAEEFGIDYDEIPRPGRSAGYSDKDESGETQAQALIELAEPAELFHDLEQIAYATFPVGGHMETWPLRAKGFRRWLIRRFYELYGKPPGAQALQDALGVLEAKAAYDGLEYQVFTRIGGIDDRIYIDLCNDAWEAVEVTPNGWQITTTVPIKFRRTRGMLALPHPVAGGSIEELRQFVNVPDEEAWILLVAWLVAVLRPTGPYPVLCLQGEQGSAKSTTARVLRALVDPSSAPLRTVPREERDLLISAINSWIIAFDNLSGLLRWFSDGICRIATGGGFATRELYTDSDEVLFDAMRPVILNGIDSLVERHDLVDRAIILNLPRIPDEQRRDEEAFWHEFEQARPRILGALCDAVVMALRNIDNVKLDKLPRMADFAKWVTAAEPTLPWKQGAFIAAYAGNRAEAVKTALENDVVATALIEFLDQRTGWEGTARELLGLLADYVPEKVQKSKVWPKSPRGFSGRLRRAVTFLRDVGIELMFDNREPGTGQRRITLRKTQKIRTEQGSDGVTVDSHDSQPSQQPSHPEALRDMVCDGRDECDGRIPLCSNCEWEEGEI